MLGLLLVILVVCVLLGGLRYNDYGYVGFGPVELILLILLILYLTGNI